MSYIPQLIISKTDLEKKRHLIEQEILAIDIKPPVSENGRKKAKVLETIFEALNLNAVEFKGKKLVIIQPELSQHNKHVCDYLTKNNIHFTVWN